MIAVGEASGEHRIEKAFMQALDSPLLSNMHVERAEKLLYIIYSCDEKPVGIRELGEINQLMEDFTQDVEVLWGLYRDNSLGENVKVAIIASGLDEKEKSNNSTLMEDEKFNRQLETYYEKVRKMPLLSLIIQSQKRWKYPLMNLLKIHRPTL